MESDFPLNHEDFHLGITTSYGSSVHLIHFLTPSQSSLPTPPSIQGLRPGPCCPISPTLNIFRVTTALIFVVFCLL